MSNPDRRWVGEQEARTRLTQAVAYKKPDQWVSVLAGDVERLLTFATTIEREVWNEAASDLRHHVCPTSGICSACSLRYQFGRRATTRGEEKG